MASDGFVRVARHGFYRSSCLLLLDVVSVNPAIALRPVLSLEKGILVVFARDEFHAQHAFGVGEVLLAARVERGEVTRTGKMQGFRGIQARMEGNILTTNLTT